MTKPSLRVFLIALSTSLVAGMLAPLSAFATPPTINQFNSGIGGSAGLGAITSGPDGNLWFTELSSSKVGRITTNGLVTEFGTGITASSQPTDITSGPDGNLWFTELQGNKIARISTSGTVDEYTTGITGGAEPNGVTSGPDGNIWFTEFNLGRLGKITPGTNSTTEIGGSFGGDNDFGGIATGSDNNLWFTETDMHKITVISPDGVTVLHQYGSANGLTASANPDEIVAGPDGNMWFTENNKHAIGKITQAGVITEFTTGISDNTVGITVGLDGNMWFTEPTADKVGMITTGGTVTEFDVPAGSQPAGISAGADGNMWFTEPGTSSIGQLVIVTHVDNGDGTTTTTVPSGQSVGLYNHTVANHETYIVDGTAGNVIVQNGGTLKGHGLIGTLTVQSGGHLAPGNSPGCLTANGAVSLAGAYDVEVGGTTACSGYDQLQVNNTVAVGGSLNVSLFGGFVPTVGQKYTVITNDGADAVTGTFSGLVEGASFTAGGVTYTISYVGGDGNDVELTVTNVDAAAIAAAAAPKTPNTGLALLAAHPLVSLTVSSLAAATLVIVARRFKPAVKS